MTDVELQRKLNLVATLCDEIDAEAKRRYGQSGNLFFESSGSFHVMDAHGDRENLGDRLTHIQFSSNNCRLGAGAW